MDGSVNYFDVLFVYCGTIGWILWALSVVTVAVIVRFFLTILRAKLVPPGLVDRARSLFARKQYREVAQMAASDPSFLGRVLHAAMSQSAHGYPAMERAMEDAGGEQAAKLLRDVEWLNLIGNLSPMLGLLGTVWGMILAFFTIVAKGGIPHPGDLAGSIGMKLVCTLEGLMVAIPSLAVYAAMRHRIDSLSTEAMALCQELIAAFQPGRGAVISLTTEDKPTVRAVGR
jgi:biopolymer transport protein ExbB